VAGDDAALAAVGAADFDPRRVAVTERRVAGLAEVGDDGPESPGQARLTTYEDDRIGATATSTGSSMLVLTDVRFPGWKATVDGRPADIERVDYLLRGVMVPNGTHRVEFRYEPLSWRLGWIVSAIALAAIGGLALAGWRRPRGLAG
jgi:hypothetical protein